MKEQKGKKNREYFIEPNDKNGSRKTTNFFSLVQRFNAMNQSLIKH